MSETRIITKGKILQKKVCIEFLRGEGRAEVAETNKQPPHPDLINAFTALNCHAAYIGEFIDSSDLHITGSKKDIKSIAFKNDADNEEFIVTGFTIVNDGAGCILTAHRILSTGSALGFNTPTVRDESENGPGYEYWPDLEAKLKVCQSELKQYLDGKFKPETEQPELPFNGGTVVMEFSQSPEQAERVMAE